MKNKINSSLKFAFIGCGLIGNKRANTISKESIQGCFDIDKKKSKLFAKKFNCKIYEDYKKLIQDSNIIIICTPHKFLYEFTLLSLKLDKHIFVEKPAAINSLKIKKLIKKSKNYKKKLKIQVGYNHRFHPSIIKALKMIKQNRIGDIMYIRSRYGHGARKNYHKEWRMNKFISGGGELIDQGSHIIDLSRIILGKIVNVESTLKSFFWSSKVEDNAFLTLKTINNKVAFLHASCTEWKNKFSFEIFGKKGKLEIIGLGGSYGKEKLYFYKMNKNLGKPRLKIWNYSSKKDISWKNELSDFIRSIRLNKKVSCGLEDAYLNMKIIDKCYKKIKKL
tara:strand:+ start:5040 stop:6044 length:1005 start_codon:yes stop_codon:yes gene_type:complete